MPVDLRDQRHEHNYFVHRALLPGENRSRVSLIVMIVCLTSGEQMHGVVPDGDSAGILPTPPLPNELHLPSFSHSLPAELQFSCAVMLLHEEEALAQRLETGTPDERVEAALTLWRKHSRRYARTVLQLIANDQHRLPGVGTLRQEVTEALDPARIRQELQTGDYRWAAWLAYLQPGEQCVPALLKGLKDHPDALPETVIALGSSRDRRAIKPLITMLGGEDQVVAGFAARALGEFGDTSVEPLLIDTLFRESTWVRCAPASRLARSAPPTHCERCKSWRMIRPIQAHSM